MAVILFRTYTEINNKEDAQKPRDKILFSFVTNMQNQIQLKKGLTIFS